MKYFTEKLDQNLKKIFLHKTITSLALQFAGSFSIIFLYQIFEENHSYVIFFYLLLALLTALTVPFLGYFINRLSYKKCLIFGSIARLLLWASFFSISYFSWNYGVILVFLSLLFLRFFYWTPFFTEVLTLRKERDHSKSLAFLSSIDLAASVVGPVFSGIILSYFNYSFLYGFGAFLLFFAIFPLRNIEKIKNKFDWNYRKVWKEVLCKKNRYLTTPSVFNGMESMVGFLWPIFIFKVLEGDYLRIGMVMTITSILVIFINFIMGKKMDKLKNEKSMIKYGAWAHSLGWVLKIFAFTPVFIFTMDLYHKISTAVYKGSYDALMGTYMIDRGHLVDEYTVIKEVAFRVGQVFSAGSIILLSNFLDLNELFFIAAFSVLMLNKFSVKPSNILTKRDV
jgi:MFS family permease